MKTLTGLFLGAGASVEAGMPLAWDLTAEIRNWLTGEKVRELEASWKAQGGGHSEAVIADVISVLERNDLHYEAILGYIETKQQRERDPKLFQEYHGYYIWLVELVYNLLYYRQVNNEAFFETALPHFDGLRSFLEPDAPLWVFSLNHDLIIEMMAARFEVPLYCGFSAETMTLPRRAPNGTKIGEIKAEMLRRRDLEEYALNFPNPFKPGIYLLKVHGSLDTFTANDGHDLIRLKPNGQTWKDVTTVLRQANEDLLYPAPGMLGGRMKTINEITYADDAGLMQFLRRSLLAGAYKFDERVSHNLPKSMLKHFRANLNFVTHLKVIGYSFGDIHINTVLREWLQFAGERTIEIVDPQPKGIPSFLLHLAPQVSVTASPLTDYLDQRAGIVRPEVDRLTKQIGVMSRKMGAERFAAAMRAFSEKEKAQLLEALKARVEALPKKDEAPDVSGLGDTRLLGKQWAMDAMMSREQRLTAIAAFLTDYPKSETA